MGAAAPAAVNLVRGGVDRAAFGLGLKTDDAVNRAAERKAIQKLEDAGTSPEAVQKALPVACVAANSLLSGQFELVSTVVTFEGCRG